MGKNFSYKRSYLYLHLFCRACICIFMLENNTFSVYQKHTTFYVKLRLLDQWWSFQVSIARSRRQFLYSSSHKARTSVDGSPGFGVCTSFSFCDNRCHFRFLLTGKSQFSSTVTMRYEKWTVGIKWMLQKLCSVLKWKLTRMPNSLNEKFPNETLKWTINETVRQRRS